MYTLTTIKCNFFPGIQVPTSHSTGRLSRRESKTSDVCNIITYVKKKKNYENLTTCAYTKGNLLELLLCVHEINFKSLI